MNIMDGIIREKELLQTYIRHQPEPIDKCILHTLFHLGIKAKSKGFNYLVDGIKIAIEDPQAASLVTKCLYPDISKKYHTTPGAVERSIRTAILHMPVTKFRYNVFAGDMGHYSNKEFILHIAKYICYKNI